MYVNYTWVNGWNSHGIYNVYGAHTAHYDNISWMNEWMDEQMNEQTSEWMNEQMNK